jgi:hypothetical protein
MIPRRPPSALAAALLAGCASSASPDAAPAPDRVPPDALPDALADAASDALPDALVDSASDALPDAAASAFTGVVTTGVGVRSAACAAAATCAPGAVAADRVTACGSITANGMTFALPAPVSDGEVATPIDDPCSAGGPVPDWASRLTTRVVDADGEVVTAHLFADNYFELYVNGRFVARDGLGFTPFNTYAVRFQARYPMTVAVRLVDWEGFLGVGLESRNGAFHIGDGGFIASFSNGAATGAAWRCRPAYIAPLDDPGCLVEDRDGNVDSTRCPSTDTTVRCVGNAPERNCRAAHAPLPADWASPRFDDARWAPAALFDAARVTNDPAFTRYANTLFAGARFIWSRNLDLDNHVVCRVTLTR